MSLTGLLFVLAFATGCLLAFVRHPIFGLVAYVGAFYLHPPSRWWGQGLLLNVRWSLIAAAVTLVAIAIHGQRMGRPATPFYRQNLIIGFGLLILWIAVQSFWALDPQSHAELLSYYVKFAVVMYMIYRCVDTEQHLRWFLWSHVLGCFYLGWIAYTSYGGGRFEDFGGPGIGEANAGALQLATGVLVGGALFLAGDKRIKAALVLIMPIVVNGIVTTISRSGFLAMAVGGLVFNLFTPKKFRLPVRALSVVAVVLFLLLTGDTYWERIGTIRYRGAAVEGVDTGGGRLDIIRAQWQMFQSRPMGCGHMCTTVLSPSYLGESFLVEGGRASHNTFMTMLVDHGVPGVVAYVLVALWSYRRLSGLLVVYRNSQGFLPIFFPAIAGSLGAIFIADMFVQYPKFEARFWFLAILLVLSGWAMKRQAEASSTEEPTDVRRQRTVEQRGRQAIRQRTRADQQRETHPAE